LPSRVSGRQLFDVENSDLALLGGYEVAAHL